MRTGRRRRRPVHPAARSVRRTGPADDPEAALFPPGVEAVDPEFDAVDLADILHRLAGAGGHPAAEEPL